MAKRYQINEGQKKELEEARRKNKNKTIESRLKALILRAEGESYLDIAKVTGFHPTYISKMVSVYCNQGLAAIVENHYKGNRRNMSIEEEKAFLETYKAKAEQGQIIEVSGMKKDYEEKVGHTIGGSQIYYVLHRHKWRKLLPRSKHPDKASDEAIEASKKLKIQSQRPLAN